MFVLTWARGKVLAVPVSQKGDMFWALKVGASFGVRGEMMGYPPSSLGSAHRVAHQHD